MLHSDAYSSTEIEKKILGCLYGQAIGDAMGMPSELWPKSKVIAYFGWIDDFLPGPEENIAANEFQAGEFTDDTCQCVALMDAIIEADGTIQPLLIAKHIMAWANRINAFEKNILGPTSKSALNAISQGVPVEEIVANGVTNGSAMRVAPAGCLLPTHDRAQFIDGIRLACMPTHKSDIAIAGAGVIAWAISRAIEGSDWEQIKMEIVPLANDIQRQYESTFSPLLGSRIRYALYVAESQHNDKQALSDLYDMIGSGMDIIESIPTAIALVELAKTQPMKCAELAANLGGDTDTIGAMATAICGALHGIDAFTDQHITLINNANQIDFTPYAHALASYRLAAINK
ncbi:ADP-ribosylglycohydrolase family protein [Photobacterium nomapromontoriensis]|uniref:ADP-ribosylglycohydrolase family protein n=1 Tax=Photobacterium nomapromontoriensis TaxID=2910237 RepID=UPI003D0C1CCB